MVQIEFAQETDLGKRRKNNEDSLWAGPEDPELARKKGMVFIVADGLGGLSRGEMASQMAVEWVRDFFMGEIFFPRNPLWLRNAVLGANQKIYQLNRDQYPGDPMGTTFTASWIYENTLHAAHVGDTRLYRMRKKKLELLSQDHVTWRRSLERAVGIEEGLVVDMLEMPLEPGDVFLQCSDGLYPLFENHEFVRILGNENLAASARELVQTANARGGPDNITLQVIKIASS